MQEADLERTMKLIRLTRSMADCDSSTPESIESLFCTVVFRYIRTSDELNKLLYDIPKKNVTALDAFEYLLEFLVPTFALDF